MPTTLEEKRARGAAAEEEFCALADAHHLVHFPLQKDRSSSAVATLNGKSRPLPDVLLHGRGRTSYWEVKTKSLTKYGTVGLEDYRAESMRRLAVMSGLPVMYAVQLPEGWYAAEILDYLANVEKTLQSPSLVSGEYRTVDVHYVPLKGVFRPLDEAMDSIHAEAA